MKKNTLPTLPELARGQGSMRYTKKGKIEYRKNILLPTGDHVRKSVNGENVMECFKLMETLEKSILKNGNIRYDRKELGEEIIAWVQDFKEKELKEQPYRRLKSTIRNQILKYDICHYRCHSITAVDIQKHLDMLNNKHYSFSTIKKVYDCLNEFYRYIAARDSIKNPMLLVKKPRKSNINAEQKEIQFFGQDDIDRFINQCEATWNTKNKVSYRYRYGFVIAANIYMGLRIGELLALQWQDIDFERHTIYVSKTLIEIDNREYDSQRKEEMKKKVLRRFFLKFRIQLRYQRIDMFQLIKKLRNC